MNLLPTAPSTEVGAQGPGWADSNTRSLQVSTSWCPLERGPRGVHHSRADVDPEGKETGEESWVLELTTSPPTPITPHICNSQDRTDANRMRYILKRSYLSLLSRFSVFLFYNPETAVHQPPASAPQCPREQLRREVISQSDEWRPGRQAGRHRGQSKAVQITKKGKETLPGLRPSLPSKEVSLCAVLTSLQSPREGLLCLLSVLVSPRFSTLQSRDKTGAPPCHPVYMRDKITFVQK